jgi:hypothetical protein
VLSLILLLTSGCAARPNEYENKISGNASIASFWAGLWHGFISPIAFLVSLFNHDVGVYDVHNDGGWYNFGFLMGAAAILGGGGRGSARRRN